MPTAGAEESGVQLSDLPYDRLHIDGRWQAPDAEGERLTVISPFTEELTAVVPSGTAYDMDRAVAAAREVVDRGDWDRLGLVRRIELLTTFRDLLTAAAEEMAALITHEMGCPITQSRNNQVAGPLALLDEYLSVASAHRFREVRRSANGAAALVTREPVGVVAAITPWNMPLLTAMHKIVPAILAGCSVVLKPSPEAPLSAYLLAHLLESAGLPPGVFNLVPGDRKTGEHLVTHPGVDKVAFTGSLGAGRRIAALCGKDLRRVTLELGGKSAAIALDDADLGTTVEALRMGSFRNSGQVCSLKTRVLVPAKREAELLDRLAAMVASMSVGDPRDPRTQIGPVVSARQRGVVEGYVQVARDEGAAVVVGGGRPHALRTGWYVEPTVLSRVLPRMRVAQEEIFGPVLSVIAYRDEDEAVAIANDSIYGLSGAVFSEDPQRALSVARRIRTGTVEINGCAAGPAAPVGGVKGSGIGREGGVEGMESYLEVKSIGLPTAVAAALRHQIRRPGES